MLSSSSPHSTNLISGAKARGDGEEVTSTSNLHVLRIPKLEQLQPAEYRLVYNIP
jgi:hypothetical protein